MLIAARNAMMAGGKLSAKSYIQDGLVAIWDGIENAGWGVHDPNATVWKDLTGHGYDMTVTSSGAFDDVSLYRTSYDNSHIARREKISGVAHIDFVFLPLSYSNEAWYLHLAGSVGMLCAGAAMKLGGLANSGLGCPYNSEIGYFAFSYSATGYFYKNGKESLSTYRTYNTSQDNIGLLGKSDSEARYQTDGKIFRLALYSRALTADEIAANYAVDKARFNLPDAS